jgi:DNA-binding NarL/FixJ family response regulator
MADGHSNRAIAETLFLSEATVKTHLVRIYRKLGVDNRAAAVSEAVRRGLLELTANE